MLLFRLLAAWVIIPVSWSSFQPWFSYICRRAAGDTYVVCTGTRLVTFSRPLLTQVRFVGVLVISNINWTWSGGCIALSEKGGGSRDRCCYLLEAYGAEKMF